MKMKLLALLPLVAAVALGQNLLINGDFEQDLTVGWTYTDSGYGTHQADRQTSYDPDPDYEAMAYQYDNPGWARLAQRVDAPGVLLQLSFRASFLQTGGTSSCWPAACVSVCYYDGSSTLLGETRYFYSTYANWTPSPTLSLHRVNDPAWADYSLNVAEEISTNLPGVDPGDVAQVEVALLAYTYSG
ncbi:MAG: hypothetical protein R6X13_05085 [bacterium]